MSYAISPIYKHTQLIYFYSSISPLFIDPPLESYFLHVRSLNGNWITFGNFNLFDPRRIQLTQNIFHLLSIWLLIDTVPLLLHVTFQILRLSPLHDLICVPHCWTPTETKLIEINHGQSYLIVCHHHHHNTEISTESRALSYAAVNHIHKIPIRPWLDSRACYCSVASPSCDSHNIRK